MKSLASPSAAVTADMQSIGANSATSLIAAKGWGGTLESLAGTTSGTAEELMKLVKGARGVWAEFTIGTARAADYKAALEAIQNTKMGGPPTPPLRRWTDRLAGWKRPASASRTH